MTGLSEGTLALLILIGAGCALSILHVLATVVHDQTHIHDLKRRVAQLQDENARREKDDQGRAGGGAERRAA